MLRLALVILLIAVGCGGNDAEADFDEGRYDELVSEVADRYTSDLGRPASESHVREVVDEAVGDTGRDPVEILEVMVDLPDSIETVREAAFLALVELGPN